METWKPVPSKPGLQASSLGRILLPSRERKMPNGGLMKYHPKPLWGNKTKSSTAVNYSILSVSNRHLGHIKIHKVVCEAFHGPAPFPKAIVIHINENSHDNRPENLKWGTQKENLNMPKFLEYCRSRTGLNSTAYKARNNG